MRKTKIVCTIGPSSDNKETIRELMKAGMNVARINFSHGNYQEQIERINNIKEVRNELNLPVALLLDTRGPEIRIGKIKERQINLIAGEKILLTNEEIIGDKDKIFVNYKDFYNDVHIGSTILINDGIVEIKVLEIIEKDILCEIINGGPISTRKSINVPGLNLKLPNPTEKDIEDLKYSVEAGFDYIAASFVRNEQDVKNLRKVLNENNGKHIKIISKIENIEGVENFDKILELSDGIMIARGDLGVEIPMEKVPILQKQMIKKCINVAKPVITATQMLESMISNPRPTRAEVSDVANAIFDMTSAIMLSAETAAGKYPVECVKTMNLIAETTEESIKYWKRSNNKEIVNEKEYNEFNTNRALCNAAMNVDAKVIVAWTETGDTPRIVSSFVPKCPIFAITENETTYKQLALCFNIIPMLYEKHESIDALLKRGIEELINKNILSKGDEIAIAGGPTILSNVDFNINRVIGGIIKI